MQKKRILFVAALLALLSVPGASWAQNTLTVYDGTATSDHVPAYIYYWDDFSRSQFVIPADSLAAMNGGTISSLTFYTTSSNVPYTSVSTADVYLKEVAGTTLSSFVAKSTATVVYSGTVDIVTASSGGTMTITFATPYTYSGGNLLIGIENTTDAGYKNINFYGKTVTGASGAGSNSSSLDGVTFTQQNFIPKTTFTYSGGGETPIDIGNVSASSSYVPMACDYKNTVSQFIYTASEIGGACNINSIAFLHTDTPNLGGGNVANDRTVQVYLTTTSQTDYAGGANWVPVSSADQVLSADITVPGISSGSSWFTLTFDEPYFYNGSDNLVVTIVTHSDTYEDFHYFLGDETGSGTPARSLYKGSDNTVYSIGSLPAPPLSTTFRPRVKLGTIATPVWDFGDTMAYCGANAVPEDEFILEFSIPWAVKYPASMMEGRNYLATVRVYVVEEGNYTLTVYQGGEEAPQTQLFTNTYLLTGSLGWYSLDVSNNVQLDPTKSLWIVIESEAMGVVPYVLDTNSQLFNPQIVTGVDQWISFGGTDGQYATWMFYAVTSATQPALPAPTVDIVGPEVGGTGQALTFNALGSAGATFSWTLSGATPATATGTSVTATWSTPGTYNVICTATRGGLSAADTLQVTLVDCSGTLSLPFACGFESDDNLACWTFVDADGDYVGWQPSDNFHSGAAGYGSTFGIYNETLTPDNWMITPRLHITAGASLEWWDYASANVVRHEHYSVLVSTTGTATADFTDTLFETTLNAGLTWTQRTVALASYAGQDVYIAFRHHDCTDQDSLVIDDISVSTPTTAPTVTIVGPSNHRGGTGLPLTFTADGSGDATFSWTLGGATPATATGTTVTAYWDTPGTYQVICTATRNGLSAADTFQIIIEECGNLTLPFACGFENTTDNPYCWGSLDADGDGNEWAWGMNGHTGSMGVFSESWHTTLDNWLISPAITLDAANITLTWWDFAHGSIDPYDNTLISYAEHYSVLVSPTAGTQPEDFVATPLFETTLDQAQTWVQRTADLSAYAGQTVRIAFRHYNCTNQYFLLLDDLSITGTGDAPLAATIDAPATATVGTPVTFTANGPEGATYVWTFPGATPPAATTQTATATWAEAGTYTVSLLAVANGQTLTLTHDIVITDTPEPVVVTIDAPAAALVGTAVTFTADGPEDATYAWTFPGATPAAATTQTATATWAEAGTYTVTLTAVVDGETQTLTHDIVISSTPEPVVVTIDAPTAAMVGTAVTFSANGPENATYVWAFPGATPAVATTQTATVTWAEPGSYTVTLTAVVDGETQTLTHDIVITDANTVTIDAPTAANVGETVTFTAVGPADATYVWTFPGATLPAATTQTATTSWAEAGTYTVTLLAVVNGETRNLSHDITINSVGIDGVDAAAFALFPNPATATVTVGLAESAQVTLLDISGREVFRAQLPAGQHSIDLAGMAAGTYFARVTDAHGTAVRKLMVR